ncbi:MAG: glycerophosphodiester phosphodiesterase family protein [Promethearchaeota archaeon]
MSSFWGEVNGFIYVILFNNWNYTLLLFISAIVSCIYTGALIIFIKRANRSKIQPILPKILRILFKTIVPILSFIFNILILLILFVAGEEHLRLVLFIIDFFLPILFTLIVIFLGLKIPHIVSFLKDLHSKYRTNSESKKKSSPIRFILNISLIYLLYLGVFLIPLVITPSSLYSEPIPEKPKIIAHRGAAYLAPENTMLAFQKADEVGAHGWEVDVRISIDGVFFLMHDTDLKRTTDIAAVFPDKIDEDAGSFTIAELQQLDAGSWFVDRDPFGAISGGRVSTEDADLFRGVKIPLLDEILNYTLQNPHWIDIDMKKSPEDHPFASQYENLLLDKLLLSNLTDVMIKSNDPKAENFTQLFSPGDYSIEEMLGFGAELIDEKYTTARSELNEYINQNVPIMVGVLNSPIRFSQVWFLGADFVLTDTPDVFLDMVEPLKLMKIITFIPVWVSIFIISYSGGYLFYILKLKRRKSLNSET